MGRLTDAQIITMVVYEDGTSDIFEFDTIKNVKSVKVFIRNLDKVIPLAYSESYMQQ